MFKTMEKGSVLCWKLFNVVAAVTLISSGINADSRFLMFNNRTTWPQADIQCARIRSTLAILDVPDLQRIFDSSIQPNPGEKLWIGRYLGYTGIVSMEGCYHNMSLAWRRARTIPNNYLVNCLSACPDTTHIGLQNQLCYCIDAIPVRAAPLPAPSCQSRCPGEQSINNQYMTQCGRTDTNSVSIYRKVMATDVRLDRSSPNIGECIAYNTRARTWQPLECTKGKIFTCDRKPCPIPIQQCMLESTTPSTWFGGRQTCESNSGFLATVNLTTSRFFDFRQPRGDGIYWTGLHRKQAIVWKYAGDTNNDIIRSDKCVAVLKRPDGSWDWQLDSCTDEYKFVCLQEFTPITTAAPPTAPPTPRPTQRPTTRPTIRPTFRPKFTTPFITRAPPVIPKAQPVNDNDGAASMTSFIYIHAISLFLCLYIFK